MSGLKRVKSRRQDVLSSVSWDRLEMLLAKHYANEGYLVEHVGTGGTGHRFDGGIDLKLRRDDQYILVQCKGWNAYQVPHNEVHQLIGLMVNEGATGAILVTSGEFTRAAIDAAARGGHVQLVDGNALREMLGPLLGTSEGLASGLSAGVEGLGGTGSQIERLSQRGYRRHRGKSTRGRKGGLAGRLVIAAVSTIAFLLVLRFAADVMRSSLNALVPGDQHSVSSSSVRGEQVMASPRTQQPSKKSPTDPLSIPQQPTEAEIRESQRKAEEAMKVIEANTPEV